MTYLSLDISRDMTKRCVLSGKGKPCGCWSWGSLGVGEKKIFQKNPKKTRLRVRKKVLKNFNLDR